MKGTLWPQKNQSISRQGCWVWITHRPLEHHKHPLSHAWPLPALPSGPSHELCPQPCQGQGSRFSEIHPECLQSLGDDVLKNIYYQNNLCFCKKKKRKKIKRNKTKKSLQFSMMPFDTTNVWMVFFPVLSFFPACICITTCAHTK